MEKKEFDLSKIRRYQRYDWMSLKVGEGVQTPRGGAYATLAKDYCARRQKDRTFTQTGQRNKEGKMTYWVVRTA
jgi:hypothetical protein